MTPSAAKLRLYLTQEPAEVVAYWHGDGWKHRAAYQGPLELESILDGLEGPQAPLEDGAPMEARRLPAYWRPQASAMLQELLEAGAGDVWAKGGR